MNELTGIGGDATDRSLVSISATNPQWLLRPLPLTQVNPQARYFGATGVADSLQSCCLSVISRNLDKYAPTQDSFAAELDFPLIFLPSVIFTRVVARLIADRGYSSLDRKSRPDAATLWAYIALCDPEGLAKHDAQFTLQLPPKELLATLPWNPKRFGLDGEHPLNSLPRLFNLLHPLPALGVPPRLSLLTTLSFDKLSPSTVTDSTVQSLKYCTHLTALWMRGCSITDQGIRLLASSLVLPVDSMDEGEARGMWRLRAWYLPGCKGISDFALRSLSKWPGLSVLDVRNTSCTSSGKGIFNRYSQGAFGGLQPDMQACTSGLRGLFTASEEPSVVLDKLCLTLLKPDLAEQPEPNHISLHIVPGPAPRDELLHDSAPRPARRAYSLPEVSVYRDGIGVVYGKGVSSIKDVKAEMRERKMWVEVARSRKDNVDDWVSRGVKRPKHMAPLDLDAFNRYWQPKEGGRHSDTRVAGKRTRARQANLEANTRSQVFFAPAPAVRSEDGHTPDELVAGSPEFMFVRMVHPEWRRLGWAKAKVQERQREPTVVRKRARVDDPSDLLASVPISVSSDSSQPSARVPSSPITLSQHSSSPIAGRTPSKHLSQAAPKRNPFAMPSQSASTQKRNPFAASTPIANASGVRQLGTAKPLEDAFVTGTKHAEARRK